MKKLLATGLLLSTLGLAHAQAPTPPDTAKAAPAPNPLSYYGFVDAYYGFDFNHDNTNVRPYFLYAHNRQNEFTVNNAVLGARYDDGRVRGSLSLHAGTYVSANYASEDPVLKHIYEAYAGFRPFKKAWLDLGIFTSHIGFESAREQRQLDALTRSIMAENSPYYESGARFTYEVGPKLTLTRAGAQWLAEHSRKQPGQGPGHPDSVAAHGEDSAKQQPRFTAMSSPRDSLIRRRYFHDFYITYAAAARLNLALVFDVGKQQSAFHKGYDTWHAGSAFVKYKLAEQFSTTLRGEYYYAQRGGVYQRYFARPDGCRFQGRRHLAQPRLPAHGQRGLPRGGTLFAVAECYFSA